jgi:antitoxin component YwqK of YwqJK toxin-antitoxin module
MLSEGTYANGLRVGVWKNWYLTGVLQIEGDYTGQGGDGEFSYYYESGGPESTGAIQGGVRVGVWKEWWPNGNLEKDVTFRSGQLDGPCQFLNKQGEVDSKRSGNYSQGKLL